MIAMAGCGRTGFAQQDSIASPDLSHIRVAPGWSAAVAYDFSTEHPYVDVDFVDGAEMYSNGPGKAFTLSLPYAQGIGVIAGRDILVITKGLEIHSFGAHPPNTAGLPDELTGAVWANPTLLATSSSLNDGDGVFGISANWTISQINTNNNMRDVTYDLAGGFDGVGVGAAYYGDITGVYRLGPPDVMVATSVDASSVHVAGDALLFVDRRSDTDADLVSVASTSHTTTVLATSATIQLADGDALAPQLGWATLSHKQLVEIVPGAAPFQSIAETTDPLFTWQGAAIPPPSHPLAMPWPSIYLVESNRALGIDRLLRFTKN